jgi:hypothetical protein
MLMNPSQDNSNATIGASSFTQLAIEDLVRDRLVWQGRLEKMMNSNTILPSVIHPIKSNIVKIA